MAFSSQLGAASLPFQLGSLGSVSSAGTFTIAVSDTLVLTDEVITAETLTQTSDDTLALTDDAVVELLSPIEQQNDDSFTLSDELLAELATEAEFSDTLSLSDDPSTQLYPHPLDVTLSDTLSFTDAVTTEYVLVPHYYDSLASLWADGVQVSLGQGIAVADTLSLSDALALSSGYEIAFGDNFTVSDNLELFFTLTHETSDLLALLDAILVTQEGHGVLDDTFSFTDDVSVLLGTQVVTALTATVSDTIALTDAIRVQKPYPMKNYLRRYLNDKELV